MPLARRFLLWLLVWLSPLSAARADRVDELVSSLQSDPSYKVRTQAALVLGKLGDPRGVVPLIQALRDSNDAVRGAAAAALGQLGDPRAVEALVPLREDPSNFVRVSAQKALERLGPTRPPATPPSSASSAPARGPARFFVMVNVNRGPADAVRALREILLEEIGRLPRVTTRIDGTPSADALQARHLTGWQLEGTITGMKVSGGQLDCDVQLAIATYPGRVLRATANAGASVPGVQRAGDPAAQRDCLAGAAQQLAEDVAKFFRTVQ